MLPHASFSPELAPSDYFLFPNLKKMPQLDEAVMSAIWKVKFGQTKLCPYKMFESWRFYQLYHK